MLNNQVRLVSGAKVSLFMQSLDGQSPGLTEL
jgi:hypothetical protein